jgi:hypothetical protein
MRGPEMAKSGFLSPVRLPFRHSGMGIFPNEAGHRSLGQEGSSRPTGHVCRIDFRTQVVGVRKAGGDAKSIVVAKL